MKNIRIYRRKSEQQKSLPRLLARLSPNNPRYQEISEKAYRIQAGYAGEVKVDRYLESTIFPEKVTILTDVQLPISNNFFVQIDTLIISPTMITLLEIKNITGTLTYISNPPHFERTIEGTKAIVIDCPIMQLNNNRSGINIWLARNGFPPVTEAFIVLANSKTSVKDATNDMRIMYAKHLPYYFRTREKGEVILCEKKLRLLVTKIRSEEAIYNPYPLCEKNGINPNEIKRGYICDTCAQLLQRKTLKTWYCPTCKIEVKEPYEQALRDWFMLIKNTISNEECRKFLGLKDKYAANYILKKYPLKRLGRSTTTRYLWDYQLSPSNMTALK